MVILLSNLDQPFYRPVLHLQATTFKILGKKKRAIIFWEKGDLSADFILEKKS